MTYQALQEQACCFAGYLQEQQIGKGDRVCIWAASCSNWMVAYLGALLVGAVVGRNFLWRTVLCLFPVLLAGWVSAGALLRYERGEPGGAKLGVDLVGGFTALVQKGWTEGSRRLILRAVQIASSARHGRERGLPSTHPPSLT